MAKWNPYPKTRPKREGSYLVTKSDHSMAVLNFVDYKKDSPERPDSWEDDYQEINSKDILAWVELPTPYYKRESRRKK